MRYFAKIKKRKKKKTCSNNFIVFQPCEHQKPVIQGEFGGQPFGERKRRQRMEGLRFAKLSFFEINLWVLSVKKLREKSAFGWIFESSE